MKLFSIDWTGMLRKQLTGHTNEKGRQIRIDTVGGKTIWLTNRVWDVPTNILCHRQLVNRFLRSSCPCIRSYERLQIKSDRRRRIIYMSKAITEKKYYRVGETFSYTDKDYIGLLDIPFGIWVTTHSFEVISSMKWEKAYKLCTQITGKIIDESVKNCCIFVYLDGANYDKEEYRQVTWDELMKECTPVEVIVYE